MLAIFPSVRPQVEVSGRKECASLPCIANLITYTAILLFEYFRHEISVCVSCLERKMKIKKRFASSAAQALHDWSFLYSFVFISMIDK